ncbi:MAG: hypothetical protein KDI20_06980, partial [Pseudomonadales bacterium]|nr:hypothetical protein [Pseudomonadales bacterium]
SLVPLLFGVMMKRELPLWIIAMCAFSALGIHLVLNLLMGVANPAVSASYAILFSLGLGLISLWLRQFMTESAAPKMVK